MAGISAISCLAWSYYPRARISGLQWVGEFIPEKRLNPRRVDSRVDQRSRPQPTQGTGNQREISEGPHKSESKSISDFKPQARMGFIGFAFVLKIISGFYIYFIRGSRAEGAAVRTGSGSNGPSELAVALLGQGSGLQVQARPSREP